MRKFTYKMPLCGEYELSNLLLQDTMEKDGCWRDALEISISKCSGLASKSALFEPISQKDNDLMPVKNVMRAIRNGSYDMWQTCGAYITYEGLRVLFINIHTKKQASFRLTKSFSSITMAINTRNSDCDIQRLYQYRECYVKRDNSHLVEVTEYEDNANYRRVIQFVKNENGSTDLLITDYRS